MRLPRRRQRQRTSRRSCSYTTRCRSRGAVGVDPTTLPDCGDGQRPAEEVRWSFTLIGDDDDDVVLSTDAMFENAGTIAIDTRTRS